MSMTNTWGESHGNPFRFLAQSSLLALDAVIISKSEKNRRVETPHLDVRYQPTEWGFATDPVPARIKR